MARTRSSPLIRTFVGLRFYSRQMKSLPLSVADPELAKEAFLWDPSKVSSLMGREMDWKCAKGHFFQMEVAKRVRKKLGCPYCTNKWLERGINDLTITHPDMASEADGWDPNYEVAGSVHSRSWKCPQGHTYRRQVIVRTGQGRGCPICQRMEGTYPNGRPQP